MRTIRRLALFITLLALISFPASSQAVAKPSKAEIAAMKACSNKNTAAVKACIKRAALHREVSYNKLYWIAFCESSLDPNNGNGGSEGLFAFELGTWLETIYAKYSRYSAKWSSLAAAKIISESGDGKWRPYSGHCWVHRL